MVMRVPISWCNRDAAIVDAEAAGVKHVEVEEETWFSKNVTAKIPVAIKNNVVSKALFNVSVCSQLPWQRHCHLRRGSDICSVSSCLWSCHQFTRANIRQYFQHSSKSYHSLSALLCLRCEVPRPLHYMTGPHENA